MELEDPSEMDWCYDSPAALVLSGLSPVGALLELKPAVAVDDLAPASDSTTAPVLALALAPTPAPAVSSPVAPFLSSLAPTPSSSRALHATPPATHDPYLDGLEEELEAELMKDDEGSPAAAAAPVFAFDFNLPGAPAPPIAFGFGEKVAAPERAAVAAPTEEECGTEGEITKDRASPCALSDALPDSDGVLTLPRPKGCVQSWGSSPQHSPETPTPAPRISTSKYRLRY